MTTTELLLVAVVWLVCGLGAYFITAQKGRDDAGSQAIMGVLLGPIGLVLAATASKPRPDATARVCVNCGKTVAQDRERLCNHCGQAFA